MFYKARRILVFLKLPAQRIQEFRLGKYRQLLFSRKGVYAAKYLLNLLDILWMWRDFLCRYRIRWRNPPDFLCDRLCKSNRFRAVKPPEDSHRGFLVHFDLGWMVSVGVRYWGQINDTVSDRSPANFRSKNRRL